MHFIFQNLKSFLLSFSIVFILVLVGCQHQLSHGPPLSPNGPNQVPLPGQILLTLVYDAANSTTTTQAVNIIMNSDPKNLPAALQWTLQFNTQDFTSTVFSEGAQATAASKNVTCAAHGAGQTICVLVGMNLNKIQNGVVAKIRLGVNGSSLNPASALALIGLVAATFDGLSIPIKSLNTNILVPAFWRPVK